MFCIHPTSYPYQITLDVARTGDAVATSQVNNFCGVLVEDIPAHVHIVGDTINHVQVINRAGGMDNRCLCRTHYNSIVTCQEQRTVDVLTFGDIAINATAKVYAEVFENRAVK